MAAVISAPIWYCTAIFPKPQNAMKLLMSLRFVFQNVISTIISISRLIFKTLNTIYKKIYMYLICDNHELCFLGYSKCIIQYALRILWSGTIRYIGITLHYIYSDLTNLLWHNMYVNIFKNIKMKISVAQ